MNAPRLARFSVAFILLGLIRALGGETNALLNINSVPLAQATSRLITTQNKIAAMCKGATGTAKVTLEGYAKAISDLQDQETILFQQLSIERLLKCNEDKEMVRRVHMSGRIKLMCRMIDTYIDDDPQNDHRRLGRSSLEAISDEFLTGLRAIKVQLLEIQKLCPEPAK